MIKKILKYTGITILVIIILMIITPFIFKGKIVKVIKQETNKNVNAKVDFGDFGLNLFSHFPNFTLTINDVTVDGVDTFKNVQLANVKKLKLVVNLMSVISGDQINIKSIILTHPNINVMVLKDGTANYDIAKETADSTAVEDTTSSSFLLSLEKLELNNGYIIYDDKSMNMSADIRNANLSLSGDFTTEVSDIKTEGTMDTVNYVYDNIAYLKNAKVALEALIKADLAKDKYTFKENDIKVNSLELGFDGWLQLLPDDAMDMDLKFNSKQADFKTILSLIPAVYTNDFKDVKTKGKMSLKGKYTETAYPAFAVNLNIKDAMFKYPSLPKSVNDIQVICSINSPGADLDQMVIDLKKFHLEMAGNPLDATMLLKKPMSDRDIKANLKGKIDLNSLKDIIPQEEGQKLNGQITADIAIKGKVSSLQNEKYEDFYAKGTFGIDNMLYASKDLDYDVKINKLLLNFTPEMAELSSFDSKIGNSDIKASGKLDNILQYALTDSAVLKGSFNMTSNYMDLDQFMGDDSTATASEDSDSTSDEPLSVFEVPKNMDITLGANIKELHYDDLGITNVEGKMKIKNQKVSITKSSMDLMDGTMEMTGYYATTNPKKPDIDFNLHIKDFDVQKTATTFNTVQKLAPIAKSTSGHFSSTLSIKGVLDNKMMPIYETFNGKGRLKTKDIQVKEFKPMVKIADAFKMSKLKNWDIGSADLSFEIKDGKVFVEPFDIDLGKSKVNISGNNALDGSIDYTMKFEIPRSEFGSTANSFVDKLTKEAADKGVDVKVGDIVNANVYVTGTVQDPKIKTGLKDIGKNVVDEVKDKIKEKVTEEIDKGKKKAKEELRKKADEMIAEAKKLADKVRKSAQDLSDKTKKEGYKQAQKLEDKAKNPLEKIGAKKVADKLRKETDKKAQEITDEGNKKADAIVNKAKKSADKILKDGK